MYRTLKCKDFRATFLYHDRPCEVTDSAMELDHPGWRYRWPSPAKLNLMLHIVGRRSDGYHLLQTLFQFIDLADELRFTPRSDHRISLTQPLAGVQEEDNLIVRAAKLLSQHCPMARCGVEIELDKRIPMGAGLGGGSSNAATTLVALNLLWGCGLDGPALEALGLRLGADVPIFVRGEAAWAEGVGEQLTPVNPPTPWYLLWVPPVAIPTAAIFAAPELTRNSPPATMRDFLSGQCSNVFEPVVRARYSSVELAFRALESHGTVRLTGTGAGLFLACETENSAAQIAGQFPGEPIYVTRGCNRSALRVVSDLAANASGSQMPFAVDR